jgi:hypothetical protein
LLKESKVCSQTGSVLNSIVIDESMM